MAGKDVNDSNYVSPREGRKLWLCLKLHASKQTRSESLQNSNSNNNNKKKKKKKKKNVTKTNTTSSVQGTNRSCDRLMSTDMSEVSG